MRKLIKGFSLLEAMAALAVGSVVVISLIFFLKKYYDSQISEKVGTDLVSVVTALDERFAIDGFSASNFKRTEWKTNSDVNSLLNSLNGIDSKCNGASWIPNVDDASVVAKYRKKKLLFCDLWKTRTPYDVDTKAELRIESNNNQVVSFDIILFFKDKSDFESNFSNISNALDVAKRSDSKNNSGKHVYGYVNLNTGEEINRLKCSILNKNCGFKIALVTNEANTNIHLSTLGENKQIGKIAFSKGVLKPQTCQKWTQNTDKTWTSETVICGIEKDDKNKISFHLNQTATDYVVMNKVCDVRSTKSDFLNAKVTTGTDMAPVYNSTVPCGIYSAANGTDFLVTNISDNLSVENLYSSNTYTNKTNANTLKVADIIVQNVTNVTLKTTSGNAGMESGLTAQTLTSTGNIDTVNLKSNNPFTVSSAFKNEYLGVEKLLNVSNSLEIDNKLKTTTANINSDTNTNLFLSKGDFKLNGNINTKDFYETGILYSKNVDINGSMKIESSAAMGGYGEIGGVTNTAKTGLATTSVLVDQHAFVANDPSQNIYQIGVYDSANNLNFAVGNNGSLFIRNGLNVMGGDGSTKFSVDSSGSLNVNAPIVYFDGSGVAAQAQFYGDVYVSGNYYVTSMDRYVDVVDSSTNPNSITLDPRFFPGVSAYNLSLYRTNSLIYNKYRIDYYSNAMTNYQGYYNTVLAAINTPGLKGEKGDKGTVGDKGDVGNTGPQGDQGPQGPSGPFYDASRVIWLPKEVTCATSEAQLKTKYNVSTISSWTYNDVIEGLCENYGDGAIKYFKRTTPLTNSCSSGQSEYDVYQCKAAKFRKEPYAFNYTTQGYFCLGDSKANSNISNDNSVIDTTKNTICYTDTNANHATAGRAGSIFGIYFSIGGNDLLGSRSKETSLISTIGKNEWSVTATCGVANTRSPEDLKGIEMASKIEDTYTTINPSDIGTACSTKNEMKYRKVDASTSLVFGGPTNFENYEANSFKNVSNYVSKNANVCGRAQLYEINVCTNTYTNLSQVNYTTHPKGFPMPQNQSTGSGSTGGLTGKYIWMKDQVVCLTGDIKNTYSDVSLWYSTDRLYDQCSVENSTRYEKKGTCTDPNKTSYQLYRCKDSYYKPAGTGLSWSLSEVQCLNEDSTTGAIGNINDSYPNIEFFTKESDSSLECSNERTYKAYKDTSSNCGASKSSKYYIYQCR